MPFAAPLDDLIWTIAGLFPDGSFFAQDYNLRALFALVLVGLVCGSVGSLIVAGRLAFFSDALAHCAFAGVSIGFILFEVFLAGQRPKGDFWLLVTPVMVAFGLLFGLLIAVVRQQTGLASDTVIGVFFATAIGLAALLRRLIRDRNLFNLEEFLLGNPMLIQAGDLLLLAALAVLVAVSLTFLYNPLLLAGLDPSLANARGIRVGLVNLLFVLLLSVIVNICLRVVGALLMNALLIVPAAAAANFGRNLRQVFWLSVVLCVTACVTGPIVAWEVEVRTAGLVPLGHSGAVVLFCVLFFVASLAAPPLRRWSDRRQAARAAALANAAVGADNTSP